MKKLQLHAVAKIIAGQSPESSTYNSVGDGLPFFQGKADFQEKYPQVRVWCNSKIRKEAEPGDILMSVRAPVGSVNICNQLSIIGRGLSAIRPDSSLNGEYLYYFLKSNERKIASLGTGSTFKAITQETLKKVEIPLPPLDDQIRIARLLGKVEKLITQRKENLQQLDELLKNVFLKMFGDPVRNEKEWKKKTAIDFANCIVPGRDKPRGFNGAIPWVTTSDLQNLGYTFTSKQGIGLSNAEIVEVRARVIPAGSILITCVGDLGITSICGRDMVVNQQLHSFQVKKGMNNVFFMYAISSQKTYMYRNASTTTVPYMNKTICNRIPMIAPPTDLQNQFATVLKKVESIKSYYQHSLTNLVNLYGVLSQNAFNGELDLSRVSLPTAADLSDTDQLHSDKQDDPKPKNIKAGAAKNIYNIGNPAPFTNKSFEEFLSARKDEVLTTRALWQELKQVNFENQLPDFESFKNLVMDYLDKGRWLEQVYSEVSVDDDVEDGKFKEKKVALRIRDDS